MHHSASSSHPAPSSSWKAIVAALCTAGAAFVALSSAEPPAAPRSAAVARAEQDTRALLDERLAVHLRRLR